MNNEKEKQALLKKITTRCTKDDLWGRRNFIYAQLFVWAAILSSFGSAIASATGKTSPILIAVLAAIPGTVIVIDKSFSFARRARWHWTMVTRLQELENALMFEDASIEVTSKQLSALRKEMEDLFPGMSTEGLADTSRR